MERKTFALSEIKLAEPNDEVKEMRFSGYGAVFGNVDSYGDVIDPGAFAATLSNAQKSGVFPSMLMQHGGWGMGSQDMMPIGVWDKLSEDGHGLVSEGILAPTPRGEEAYALMQMKPRPAITGLSIGYVAKKFTVRSKPDEPRRRLHEIDLMEISLVTFPANGKARVTDVKSPDFTERMFDQFLRDAGLSRSEAEAVTRHGFKGLNAMRDAGSSELRDLAESFKQGAAVLTR